jgi:hypothetical protein
LLDFARNDKEAEWLNELAVDEVLNPPWFRTHVSKQGR